MEKDKLKSRSSPSTPPPKASKGTTIAEKFLEISVTPTDVLIEIPLTSVLKDVLKKLKLEGSEVSLLDLTELLGLETKEKVIIYKCNTSQIDRKQTKFVRIGGNNDNTCFYLWLELLKKERKTDSSFGISCFCGTYSCDIRVDWLLTVRDKNDKNETEAARLRQLRREKKRFEKIEQERNEQERVKREKEDVARLEENRLEAERRQNEREKEIKNIQEKRLEAERLQREREKEILNVRERENKEFVGEGLTEEDKRIKWEERLKRLQSSTIKSPPNPPLRAAPKLTLYEAYARELPPLPRDISDACTQAETFQKNMTVGEQSIHMHDTEDSQEPEQKIVSSFKLRTNQNLQAQRENEEIVNLHYNKLVIGSKIEANYRGQGKNYPSKSARVHLNGTYDIHYDDGGKDTMIANEVIKAKEYLQKDVRQEQEPESVPRSGPLSPSTLSSSPPTRASSYLSSSTPSSTPLTRSNYYLSLKPSDNAIPSCFVCNAPAPLVCSRCSQASYCSIVCQKSAWSSHKTECRVQYII